MLREHPILRLRFGLTLFLLNTLIMLEEFQTDGSRVVQDKEGLWLRMGAHRPLLLSRTAILQGLKKEGGGSFKRKYVKVLVAWDVPR